jgi:transposase
MLDGEVRIVMEYTSKYYRPIANFLNDQGFFVCVANALKVHNYCEDSIRRAKTDRIDCVKIANYGLDKWLKLGQYKPEEEIRELLKVYNRQYEHYVRLKVSLTNSFLSLLDQTMPGIRKHFGFSNRLDGHDKWIDFAKDYWHCKKIAKMSEAKFAENFNAWSRKHGYRPNTQQALRIHACSKAGVTTLPYSDETKFIVQTAANELIVLSETSAKVIAKMRELAEQLPEYEVLKTFYGVGNRLAPRIIAEIGDVTRFSKKSALTAYAGLDSPPYQSGNYSAKSRRITKRGSPVLRKALFELMRVLIVTKPQDNVIYDFMQKKKSEGKPYKVYIMAGANKFLRIYYGKTMDVLQPDRRVKSCSLNSEPEAKVEFCTP